MFRFWLILSVFLLISFTQSAPADEKYPRMVHMSPQQVHERRIDEISSYEKLVRPAEQQRSKMDRKLTVDPTRLIDKHQIKGQEDKSQLHRNNFNNLGRISHSGGHVILDKSESGKRFSYTPVMKPKND